MKNMGVLAEIFVFSLGLVLFAFPLLEKTQYLNYYFAYGTILLFASWFISNFRQGYFYLSHPRGRKQRQVAVGMAMTLILGFGMLYFYEMHRPKYKVPTLSKELYKVPPMLNKKELMALGAECNTYGNTLCSHDVFKKIVELDSRNFHALANLAMAQSHLGFHKMAIFNFEKAIEMGAKTYDVYKFYGHSLFALSAYRKAKKVYEQSVALNPDQNLVNERLNQLSHM